MKFKAYYTVDPDPVDVPEDSFIIIEADNLIDCVAKSADYNDKYFWEFEEIKE